jgi:hypothetical protein
MLTSRRVAPPPVSFLPWGLPPLSLSYDVAGADGGSIRCGRFTEETASSHEGQRGSIGVGNQSCAREDRRVGGLGGLRDGSYCCGEEEEEEARRSKRAGPKDAGGEEEMT